MFNVESSFMVMQSHTSLESSKSFNMSSKMSRIKSLSSKYYKSYNTSSKYYKRSSSYMSQEIKDKSQVMLKPILSSTMIVILICDVSNASLSPNPSTCNGQDECEKVFLCFSVAKVVMIGAPRLSYGS